MLNSDWLSDSTLDGDWLYFHMGRTLYAKLTGRIAFFTCANRAHIEFYLQGFATCFSLAYLIMAMLEFRSLLTILSIYLNLGERWKTGPCILLLL